MLKPRGSRLVHGRVYSLIIVAREKNVNRDEDVSSVVVEQCDNRLGKSAAEHAQAVARMLCYIWCVEVRRRIDMLWMKRFLTRLPQRPALQTPEWNLSVLAIPGSHTYKILLS